MRLPFDSRILKIALAAAALAYAIQCFMTGYTGSGIGMVLLAVVFGLSAARSLRMVLVAFRIQQQKMDKAREVLAGINPQAFVAAQPRAVLVLAGQPVVGVQPDRSRKSLPHCT